MSWRTVVIASNAKLDLRLGYLVITKPDETLKVHISEIAVLMVESTAVSLTASLLSTHSTVSCGALNPIPFFIPTIWTANHGATRTIFT